ncbi:MAG: endonuclease/exonuclease/phosphatase family protein [Rhodoglobus sp.]
MRWIPRRNLVLASVIATASVWATLGLTTVEANAATSHDVRIVTANVDFGVSDSTVKERFRDYSRHADIVLIQEAKNVNLHRLLDSDNWIVRQRVGSGNEQQGSAVVVRRSLVEHRSDVSDLDLTLGTNGNECRIMARYIATATVKLAQGGLLRVASVHLPPRNDCQTGPGSDYDEMIKSIARLSDRFPHRLVIGGDWNKIVRSDPNELSRQADNRIVPRGPEGSIDGFYIPRDFKQIGAARTVGFASKGHRATQVILEVPAS